MSSSETEYFCHQCNKTIIPLNFQCPTCKGEFIEEITPETEDFVEQIQQHSRPSNGSQNQQRQQNNSNSYSFSFGPNFNGNVSFQSFSTSSSSSTGNGFNSYQRLFSNMPQQQQQNGNDFPINQLLNSFMQSMGNPQQQQQGGVFGGLGGLGGTGGSGQNSIQFGDYVFGNMDDLLNRLMEQNQPKGPPPASK